MTKWLSSPWLAIRVQLALGVFFVAAALPKIVDPPSFAHMVYNYRIMPGGVVNLMALVMPWIELLCGLALILGIWTAAARAIVAAMLFVFIAAISVNLARGNAIDCGCFPRKGDGGQGTGDRKKTNPLFPVPCPPCPETTYRRSLRGTSRCTSRSSRRRSASSCACRRRSRRRSR